MKKKSALILILAASILACACAKTPQAGGDAGQETEAAAATEAVTEAAVTEAAAETEPAVTEETEPETLAAAAANEAEPEEVPTLKRNQNRGYFVEHDGKVYYRFHNADALAESALFGQYMSGFLGSSEIRCYDPAVGKSESFRNSLGWGEFFVTGDKLVSMEKDFPNDLEVEERELIDFNTAEGSIWGDFGTQILTINDDYVIYEEEDWENCEFTVYCYSIKEDSTNRLGKLESFEYTSAPGIMQQFYSDGSDIWFLMADFEGTGHFYYDAKLYRANVDEEDSLSVYESEDVDELPDSPLPEDFGENHNRAPGFVIKDGKPFKTEGEPGTAEVDYGTGELVYYDESGRRVVVSDGYESFESDEEGTWVNIEFAEYVNGKIFLVRNENWRDAENDVGWREAYARKFTYVVMVDPETGEETIIDFAQAPPFE